MRRRRVALVLAVLLVAAGAMGASPAVGADETRAASSSPAVPAAGSTSRFLTLPFKSLYRKQIQQTWFFTDGTFHHAIDYIRGTIDDDRTWRGFPVVAAAGGQACGEVLGHDGCVVRPGIMGNRVLIRHRVNGTTYYTFYNHLQWIAPQIPVGSSSHTVHVKRGEVIGFAGHSGDSRYLIHLHFELLDASFRPLDPYGIYGKRWRYPNPPGTNGKRSKPDNYWTTNPPTLAPQYLTP